MTPPRCLTLLMLTIACVGIVIPTSHGEQERFGHPGTEEGARALLAEFLKPNADCAKLTYKLRPHPDDYAAYFEGADAVKAMMEYEPHWRAGNVIVCPKPSQTEMLLYSATTDELKAGSPSAMDYFPGGYKKAAPHLRAGHTVYRFKFVRPGKHMGMAYDGLVHVNGHWAIFPKPWRIFKE